MQFIYEKPKILALAFCPAIGYTITAIGGLLKWSKRRDSKSVCGTATRGFESHPLRHQRNLFCLPRQKGFFLAFWGKNGLNMGKSGFDAVDWLLRSPIFCFQRQEQPENAGVLFAFLCSVKKEQKGVGGGSRTDYSLRISSHVMI